jgi:hypothetical protein
MFLQADTANLSVIVLDVLRLLVKISSRYGTAEGRKWVLLELQRVRVWLRKPQCALPDKSFNVKRDIISVLER